MHPINVTNKSIINTIIENIDNTKIQKRIMSESMNCSISVKICDNGKEVYSACKTAQEMKDAGYQQPQLQTDEVPLEPLKENEVFYLAAAVEVMKSF